MELTSQVINEAEFSMARRGYDPDQVDEFLEKLAVAVDKQNQALVEARQRLAEAERRAIEAERRLDERPERVVDVAATAATAPPAAPVLDDEAIMAAATARKAELTAEAESELATMQRTLLLAQKTADATVREAEDEARKLIAKAEIDAREAEAVTRATILEEIASLDTNRKVLAADVATLDGHIAQRRRQLQGAVADLQRLLTDPARLDEPRAPTTSGVAAMVEPAASDPVVEGPAELAPVPSRSEGVVAVPDQAPPPAPGAPPSLRTRDDLDASPDRDPDAEAWSQFAPEPDGIDVEPDPGPPTQPVPSLADLEGPRADDDAYLAELRKAMLDDTSAPDLDDVRRDERDPWR